MEQSHQNDIDARIQAYYEGVFDESTRLTTRSPQGALEFERTQELIRQHVQRGRILDIGGGAGIHAEALQHNGYDTVLIDPVPRHIDTARAAGVDAQLGDARDLPFANGEFDAALMLGPLYHLGSEVDRQRALTEVARVLRPAGVLFAAAVSRYVAFGQVSLTKSTTSRLPDEWAALITAGTPSPRLRFPAGHFHTAEELQEEVEAAGFEVREVVGVEGPAGTFLEAIEEATDELRNAALLIARAASSVPGIRDQSQHLIAIAQLPT